MGISSLRAWILAASLLSVSAVAHAAGLGRINVTSALGQPFKAEVELVASKNELPSLAVRMASPEAFARSGLTYTPALADVKVSIEKRGDGEPYVQLTSTTAIEEPFIDLMLELSWASGRITRQFTALLDPPHIIAERERQKAEEAKVRAAPSTPEPEAEPMPAPEAPADQVAAPAEQATPTEPSDAAAQSATTTSAEPASAPVETIGGTAPTMLEPGSALSSMASSADAYGPVKNGDTLSKIARAHKPSEVSLEQMLVLLYRANPDAFAGQNMNRLKTGRILQLPAPGDYASISATEARREVLAQARDWNAYREQVAVAAGQTEVAAEPTRQADAGKVAPTVEEKPAPGKEAPKEVLKLSRNEPAAGAAAGGGEGQSAARVKALEEELVARDKAVKEANERVARLEKTVKDLQTLLEIKNKGMADLQKSATPTTPAAPAQPAAPEAAAPKPAPETPAPATPAPPPTSAAPAPEAQPATPPATTPAPGTEAAPAPAQPAPAPPKPAPKRAAPPPPPEPSLMDRVLEQPAYLGAGAIALILIGVLAVRAVKRRRESKAESDESGPAIVAAAPAAASTFGGAEADGAMPAEGDDVDPVKEAEIFLAYGRDAQAEELLKEALAANPNRQEVRLLLLQIYAKRKDAKSFEQVARELQQATGSSGPLWEQATALGYQVDPENPRYAAGKTTGIAMAAAMSSAAADNVDFNIGGDDASASTATDIDLGDAGSSSALERTQVIDPGAESEPAHDTTVMEAPVLPDVALNVDLPVEPAEPAEAEPANSSGGLDFDIDLNAFSAPQAPAPVEPAAPAADNGLDFDMSGLSLDTPAAEPAPAASAAAPEIDLSTISLDLGETTPRISPSGKDDHWYDVQTKFDLAKAYQEMGDKDGAREILKEVLQEGDAEQKAAAQTVLASLDS